ncbi:MAG: chorismate synthase [Anaerolineae bacterium]|nr:chorismate synthase [Anaerolineae bacterium]
MGGACRFPLLRLSADDINGDLARRQVGFGAGGRMKIEKDEVEILSGLGWERPWTGSDDRRPHCPAHRESRLGQLEGQDAASVQRAAPRPHRPGRWRQVWPPV